MAKKQVIVKETAAVTTKVRAAKPKAPRVKAAQHSKIVSAEPIGEPVVTSRTSAPVPAENPHDTIARIAYHLWEGRGFTGGSAVDDWLCAEGEYQKILAAAF